MRAWIFSLRAIRSENAEVNNARFRSHDLGLRAAYDLASEMARKYPNDAQALMVFSITSAFSYWSLPPEEVAPAMRAGRAAAERVTELAPTFGEPTLHCRCWFRRSAGRGAKRICAKAWKSSPMHRDSALSSRDFSRKSVAGAPRKCWRAVSPGAIHSTRQRSWIASRFTDWLEIRMRPTH